MPALRPAREHDGRAYLVMEYVNGGSLASRLVGAPWAIREAALLVETLAQAIHHAHVRGIVHRDLTPGNVLLGLDGEALPDPGANDSARASPSLEHYIPKITDFGLAKLHLGEGEARTQSGMILGTPSYMAPEQAEGRRTQIGPAADIYGFVQDVASGMLASPNCGTAPDGIGSTGGATTRVLRPDRGKAGAPDPIRTRPNQPVRQSARPEEQRKASCRSSSRALGR